MAQKDSPSGLGLMSWNRKFRAALGELKCERLSCGFPVELGVYSVEDAPAKTMKRSALASATEMPDEKKP